jgi:ureidoglycolate lyase
VLKFWTLVVRSEDMRRIVAQPLTGDRFAEFGQVLELPAQPGRVDYSALLENTRPDAQVCFRTGMVVAVGLPLTATVMERHEFSSQAFLPIDAARYLVLVAPPAGPDRPDVSGLRAFIAASNQGINYRAGTWHHPMTALDHAATFATVMWNDGGPGDEEFVDLPEPVQIVAGEDV